MSKTSHLNLRLRPEDKDRLKGRAKALDTSVAELVCHAVLQPSSPLPGLADELRGVGRALNEMLYAGHVNAEVVRWAAKRLHELAGGLE